MAADEMISRFFCEQLDRWDLARKNFEALKYVETKHLRLGGHLFTVMYNPAREVSSGAKVDAKSIAERPCFLCAKNRPEEQIAFPILPGYSLLVNPFPIFDRHFTIPSDLHQPQSILAPEPDGTSRLATMFRLAKELENYTVFYNGPKCGASAPDHLHFQAVPSSSLDALTHHRLFPYEKFEIITDKTDIFVEEMSSYLNKLSILPENQGLDEPRVNIFVQSTSGKEVYGVISPRRAHRPSCYGAGEEEMLISPGAIDVGGTIICCRKRDYQQLNEEKLRVILGETTCFNPPIL